MINRNSKGFVMLKYAMNYGVILGSFWVFKYIFLIASSLSDHFLYIYNLLAIGTLLLYYVLLRRYRDFALGGKINYLQCISFSVLLFLFSALIEAVIIYIHYNFIDPKYVLVRNKGWLEMVLKWIFSREWVENQKETFGNIIVFISEVGKNIVIGFFLSLVYGIFVTRKSTIDTKE
ncbi:DUF4199 domain-containing protein [Dysgonomonas sp. 216]|uniref:DUF4199 domain-containing protein n=1 Tax=Dysgonomonas sp. 216 TaxID=2302934 RepID=UPI0013D0F136|nr:DUF4199 domain-containing protein [Dysgonomonas sp. 216]NDW19800.1 DUF4199 domain-containing protein [Dysgonomonas sp. 216]